MKNKLKIGDILYCHTERIILFRPMITVGKSYNIIIKHNNEYFYIIDDDGENLFFMIDDKDANHHPYTDFFRLNIKEMRREKLKKINEYSEI